MRTLIIYNDLGSDILYGIIEGDYSSLNGANINVDSTEKENKACTLLFDHENGSFNIKLSTNIKLLENKQWDKVAVITFVP